MTTDTDVESKSSYPYLAYVLGSVILWMAFWPLADWIIGEWRGLGSSLGKGATIGLLYGLSMYPFEQWLRRRKERKAKAPAPPGSTEP